MKILFVFHEAKLTGASLALYRMVLWLAKNTDISMSFLFKEGGVLKEEISKIGPIFSWEKEAYQEKSRIRRRIERILNKKTSQQKCIEVIAKAKYDIIYFNTILCADIIKKLSNVQAKKIWHIHELELAIKTIGDKHLQSVQYVDHIVANSDSTKNNLVKRGINEIMISVFYPIIQSDISQTKLLNQYFFPENMNISDSFVIGTSGNVMERKGVQTFIILAKLIDTIYSENNFVYVWVGSVSERDRILVEHDIEKSGLKNKMFFVGEQSNPYPIYTAFDVFVSTSKEESFGLALVEAAFLNKALICFDNTGGIEEVVRSLSNFVVPYLDVFAMGQKIIELSKNKKMISVLGDQAFEKSKIYDQEVIMPRFYDYLKLINN